ncbi:hypothetical protein HPB52_018632 [Rhipicephalus sanguineus]|uniref:Uncharacterized protein n=1 Tax=Rhipicephalus sanguineus TaxID=34632 RepID=A0A9D4PG97_RHISA|nr:hypothetical protein HPB52_018632 [Rhipicephalus sanguineus]
MAKVQVFFSDLESWVYRSAEAAIRRMGSHIPVHEMAKVQVFFSDLESWVYRSAAAAVRRMGSHIPGATAATSHWACAFIFPQSAMVPIVEAIRTTDGRLVYVSSWLQQDEYVNSDNIKQPMLRLCLLLPFHLLLHKLWLCFLRLLVLSGRLLCSLYQFLFCMLRRCIRRSRLRRLCPLPFRALFLRRWRRATRHLSLAIIGKSALEEASSSRGGEFTGRFFRSAGLLAAAAVQTTFLEMALVQASAP